jgi:hypothetical protein
MWLCQLLTSNSNTDIVCLIPFYVGLFTKSGSKEAKVWLPSRHSNAWECWLRRVRPNKCSALYSEWLSFGRMGFDKIWYWKSHPERDLSSPYPHPVSLWSILMLSYAATSPEWPVLFGFSVKSVVCFLMPPMHAACSAHFILDLMP